MNDVMWDFLALLVTALGAVGTWWAFTRRGATTGMLALGWTLLVPAAWLTGIFTLVGRVTTAVSRWASGIVLSFGFWLGIGLGALAVVMILTATALRARESGPRDVSARPAPAGQVGRPARGAARPSAAPAADDGLDDIEELLRRRGIE